MSHRTLDTFKESKRLAVKTHAISRALPKFELCEEGSQVRRSSKAITTAIVEGYARRRYKNDYIKFLTYGQAECDETITHIDFLFETESLRDKDLYDELRLDYDTLSMKINKFIQWVEDNL